MWILFLFCCVYQAVSSALATLAWIRMRKAEQECRQVGEETALRLQENGELKGLAASREAQLHEQQTLIESLQQGLTEKSKELGALSERCTHLDAGLQRHATQVQERLIREQEQHDEWTERTGDLEGQLAASEEKLIEQTATIARLHAEASATALQAKTLGVRCAELEQELQRGASQGQSQSNQEQELQGASSARVAELEASLSSREQELAARAAAIERMQDEASAKQIEVEVLGRRCGEFDRELQRGAEQRQELLDQERAAHGAFSTRAAELEGLLAIRECELHERVATIERLGKRCGELDRELQRGAEQRQELLDQERAAHAAFSTHAAELESLLAIREDELRERAATIESLGRRCGELDQELNQGVELRQDRLRQEQEVQRGLSARAAELESQLALRSSELRQCAVTIEALQAETNARRAEMESAGPRIGELERALEEQDAKEHLLLDHMLHSALSARAEELECCVADSLTELHREFEITRSLLEAVESTELELEAARLRGAELDQQLQLRTEEQRALAAASSARVLELEGELARCSEELREVRDEYSQLTDRCRAAAGLVEEREQQFAKISASMEALDYAIQSCHEEIRASEGLIDELAESRVTARFQRRSHTRSQPLPALYLKGLAQGDLILALQGLLGDVEPLSAESVARLASRWHDAHKAWKQLLIGREVAYLWADGVHLEAGSERESIELLVVVAAFVDGSRSVIAVELGERGSKETWLALMQDLARRGMNTPRIAIADSALGLWAALDELGWDCARQYCWNYKAAEVQAALPKKRHAQASKMLRAIAEANSRTEAKQLRHRFVKRCGVRLADAGARVSSDWKQLTSFHAFPKEHWSQLRTTESIEAPLSAIRVRACGPKASKPAAHVEAILWKLLGAALRTMPLLDPLEMVPSLVRAKHSAKDAPVAASKRRAS